MAPWGLALLAMAIVVRTRLIPQQLPAADAIQREQLTFRAADGRDYVYALGYDAYAWLRQAENRLRIGSPCDAEVNGVCRDQLTLAPLGAEMPYRHSPHVIAIATLQRLVTSIRPGFPLSESGALVSVIVGALGVLPAFAIGRALAGTLGGFTAALLVSLNPVYIVRSGTADNDVWNVVLPLYLGWAALGAMRERRFGRQLAWALAGTAVAGLHALVWRGWVFSYVVVGTALAVDVAIAALAVALGRRGSARDDLRQATGALAAFAAAALAGAVAMAAIGRGADALDLARSFAGEVQNAVYPTPPTSRWADALSTVSELIQPDLRRIADMTGAVYFFAAWLGMVVLLLPRRGWQPWHFVLLIAANYAYRYLLTNGPPSRAWLMLLLAAPLAAAMVVRVLPSRNPNRDSEPVDAGAILVITWFLAALFLCFDGLRFVMLLAPGVGIAFGVAVGRLGEWIERIAVERKWRTDAVRIAVFCALSLSVLPALQNAERVLAAQWPRVNDAWADLLGELRTQSPPDAIVHTWWPYGYFATYFAGRRVSADGSSLATHVPHWLARALLAEDEREALGLLRMIDCGSDTSPHADRVRGAYAQILARLGKPAAAYDLLSSLVARDRAGAEALLANARFSVESRASVLEATHCDAPPTYVLLTDELLRTLGWSRLGSWRPDSSDGSGPTDAPAPSFSTAGWVACAPEAGSAGAPGATMVCPLRVSVPGRGIALDAFAYTRANPWEGVFRWHGVDSPRRGQSPPAEVLVAAPGGLDGRAAAVPLAPELGVLVDPDADRVVVGAPVLLRSTLADLVLLDGRYAHGFEKVDERRVERGEHLVLWKVRSEEADRTLASPAASEARR